MYVPIIITIIFLPDTVFTARIGSQSSEPFPTTIGTPQEDALSPVLFVIYLEAALGEVRQASVPRCIDDNALPPDIIYADDTDFLSVSLARLRDLEPVASHVLKSTAAHSCQTIARTATVEPTHESGQNRTHDSHQKSRSH